MRSTVRLVMAMVAVTALALGVPVLGVRAELGTQTFATAMGLTLGGGVLNLVCGMVSASAAAAVDRHVR